MKNKNKLTLKSLQQQLEDLKKYKATVIDPKVNKVEQVVTKSTTTNLKGIGLIPFQVLSLILTNLHKVPLINILVDKLRKYYGRTSIWHILILFRKIIIIINAIIGLYFVFKLGGLGADTFTANLVGMGNTYIDIFINFTKRIFSWFVELFDYKIVPKPSDNSWWFGPKQHTWQTKPMVNNGFIDLANVAKDYYPHPLNIKDNIPWYKDWYSMLWYTGLLVGSVTVIGIGYLGYTYYSLYGFNIFTNTPGSGDGSPTPTVTPGSSATAGGDTATQSLMTFLAASKRALNPLNWWDSISKSLPADTQERIFRSRQNEIATANMSLYPYTSNDPMRPLGDKIRIALFGESITDYQRRMFDRDYALREYLNIVVSQDQILSRGARTPADIGLGLRYQSSSGLYDYIQAGSSYIKTTELIKSIPTTPTNIPLDLPFVENEWASNPSTPTKTNLDSSILDTSLMKNDNIHSVFE